MGRLEKQIIAGALALVGILLVVVVYRGLDHNKEEDGGVTELENSVWSDAHDGSRRTSLGKPGDEGAGAAGDPERAGESGTRSTPGGLPLTILPKTEPESEPGTPAAEDDPPAPEPEVQPEPVREKAVVHRLAPDEDWDVGIRSYVVREGDTLGHIALRELGSTRYVKEIELLNEGIDATRLKAGSTINLPTHVRGQERPQDASFPAGTRTHTVAAGDTLWTIAERYYQDGSEYRRILAANAGMGEATVLKIGSRIAVPE